MLSSMLPRVCRRSAATASLRSSIISNKNQINPSNSIAARAYSNHEKPFDKILIANRGEIAVRVMKTARRLGVKTVAVYSEADAAGMHVKMADEAVCIGPAASADSYLRMDRILEVAKQTGAQGIHPGYGFLSENAAFVDMVEAAGLSFIGPSSAPMHSMGDKISSKVVAKDAGCFVIPGFEGEVTDEAHAVKLANEVGYPVMLKASAGGGGKGMRVAFNDKETVEGFRMSKAEALSSFGDDRMLIERFIEDPHHIEIQVVADTFGNVAAFPERECSVQRRNQKVVEESPSCLLLPETRRKMQEQAIALCKATGYRSAGTIEMLADAKQNFYFLEMNTRLQVEHCVTELVTGEDLVEHMLFIAAGKPLPERLVKQPCRDAQGSAIESRVYAEDPLRGFLPSIGPLITYKEPLQMMPGSSTLTGAGQVPSTGEVPDGVTVRIDTGVFEGATISMHYDPMISKLCTHAPTREAAISVMEGALDQYVVQGLGNNIPFLRSVYRNEKFRGGDYSTKFIEEEYPEGFHGVSLTDDETLEFVALAAAMHGAKQDFSMKHATSTANGGSAHSTSAVGEDYRASSSAEHAADVAEIMQYRQKRHLANRNVAAGGSGVFEFDDFDEAEQEAEGEKMEVVVQMGAGHGPNGAPAAAYRVQTTLATTLNVRITPLDADNGQPCGEMREMELCDLDWNSEQPLAFATFIPTGSVAFAQQEAEGDEGHTVAANEAVVQYRGRTSSGHALRYLGCDREVVVRTPAEHALARHMLPPVVKDTSLSLLCPMPGTLVSCSVAPGDAVEEGQQLAVVEAMKMQNILRAEKAGVVKAVHKSQGQHLKVDEVILEFEGDVQAEDA